MKVTNKVIGSITNESTVEFGLDNSSGHLFAVLSELYSNPIESTIRELSTNCADAHIMSNNQSKPFIIKLPNFEKNIYNISFRDFGPGLSHEQVTNIFRWYGRSTKTEDNDVTGCLGLGSKSPYSLSDTFFVKSYNRGKCSQYTCSKDSNGKPNISDKPIIFNSMEENGLEITIPFYKEVNFKEILPKILKYFKVKPIVEIQNSELEQNIRLDMDWIKNDETVNITKTIKVNKKLLRATNLISGSVDGFGIEKIKTIKNEIIQLQIYYPLDTKLINDTIIRFNKLYVDENNEIIEKFEISKNILIIINLIMKMGFQLEAEPGKVAFAPSRETIKYTDLTLIYIIKELIKAAKVYEKQFINYMKNIDSYDKAFRNIFLNNRTYEIYKSSGLTTTQKNIVNYNKIFSKKYDLRNTPYMASGNKPKPKNIYNYEKERKYIHVSNSVSLENIKSNLSNILTSDSTKLNVVDLFDYTNWDIDSSYNNDFLYTAFLTPFTKEIIRSSINQQIVLIYKELKKYLKLHLEEIRNLSDKDYLEYINLSTNTYGFLIFREFVSLFSSRLVDKNQIIDNMIKDVDDLSFSAFHDIFENYKSPPYDKKVEKDTTGENIKNIHITDSSLKINKLKNFLSVLGGHLNLFNEIPKNMDDSKLEEFLMGYNSTNYRKFYPYIGIIYNKVVREIIKNGEKKFFNNFETKSQWVNFNEHIDRMLKYHCSYDLKFYNNVEHPFTNILKFSTKEEFNGIDSIMQITLWCYIKYFKSQFLEQLNYSKDNDKKLEELKNMFLSFNLPIEYAVKIKTFPRLEPVRRAKYSNSTKKIDFDPIKNLDLENINLKDSRIFKFHNIPNRSDIDKIKELIIKLDSNLNLNLLNLFDKFKYLHKYFTMEYSQNMSKYPERSLKFYDFKINIDEYMSQYRKAMDALRNLQTNDLIEYEKYNKLINICAYLYSINDSIARDVKIIERFFNFNHIPQLQTFDIYSKTIHDIFNNEYICLIERIKIDHNDKVIQKDIPFVEYKENEFIVSNSTFYSQNELEIINYEDEYFNNHEFIYDLDKLKILNGVNVLEEQYPEKELKTLIPDSKTQAIRKTFLNNSFKIEDLIKHYYPNYIMVKNINTIPERFRKNIINPYTLILNLPKLFWKDYLIAKKLKNMNKKDISEYILPGGAANKWNPMKGKRETTTEMIQKCLSNPKDIFANFQNSIKFVQTFGTKEMYKEYEKLCNDQVNLIHTTLDIYFNIFYKEKYEKFKQDDFKFTNSMTVNDMGLLITNLLDLFEKIIEFRSSINRVAQFKLIDEKLPKFMEDEKLTKFESFLTSIGTKFLRTLYFNGPIDYIEVKNAFANYNRPQQKEITQYIKDYKNPEEFFKYYEKERKQKILNHKINRRTKKQETKDAIYTNIKNQGLFTMGIISKLMEDKNNG